MAEATAELSIYHYAGNNPVNFNDPMGDLTKYYDESTGTLSRHNNGNYHTVAVDGLNFWFDHPSEADFLEDENGKLLKVQWRTTYGGGWANPTTNTNSDGETLEDVIMQAYNATPSESTRSYGLTNGRITSIHNINDVFKLNNNAGIVLVEYGDPDYHDKYEHRGIQIRVWVQLWDKSISKLDFIQTGHEYHYSCEFVDMEWNPTPPDKSVYPYYLTANEYVTYTNKAKDKMGANGKSYDISMFDHPARRYYNLDRTIRNYDQTLYFYLSVMGKTGQKYVPLITLKYGFTHFADHSLQQYRAIKVAPSEFHRRIINSAIPR